MDGQKTWTTDGHWADMGLALIRTDPSSARHQGLTVLLVPLSAPGVEVRPIRTIGDAIEVNEVFLTGVRTARRQRDRRGRPGLVDHHGRAWTSSGSASAAT